jgi:ABC-type Zn uptake system ZnuABC Zn-binding protein ZnuA
MVKEIHKMDYFTKTKPNLDKLADRLNNWCSNKEPTFNDSLKIYGEKPVYYLAKCVETKDAEIFTKNKKVVFVSSYPFYEYWLERYCELHEIALWNAVHRSVTDKKKAERLAEEAVLQFRKEFQ